MWSFFQEFCDASGWCRLPGGERWWVDLRCSWTLSRAERVCGVTLWLPHNRFVVPPLDQLPQAASESVEELAKSAISKAEAHSSAPTLRPKTPMGSAAQAARQAAFGLGYAMAVKACRAEEWPRSTPPPKQLLQRMAKATDIPEEDWVQHFARCDPHGPEGRGRFMLALFDAPREFVGPGHLLSSRCLPRRRKDGRTLLEESGHSLEVFTQLDFEVAHQVAICLRFRELLATQSPDRALRQALIEVLRLGMPQDWSAFPPIPGRYAKASGLIHFHDRVPGLPSLASALAELLADMERALKQLGDTLPNWLPEDARRLEMLRQHRAVSPRRVRELLTQIREGQRYTRGEIIQMLHGQGSNIAILRMSNRILAAALEWGKLVLLPPDAATLDFSHDAIKDYYALARRLRYAKDKLSLYLRGQLEVSVLAELDTWHTQELPDALKRGFRQMFNGLLSEGTALWDEDRFAGVKLRSSTQRLLTAKPVGAEAVRLR